MPVNSYISIKDYILGVPGIVLFFTLQDLRGVEINRQLVPVDKVMFTREGTVKLKYIVDAALSSIMIPGTYKLFLYTAFPLASAPPEAQPLVATPPTVIPPTGYTLDKCLTQKGVEIRVRGGLEGPSVGE